MIKIKPAQSILEYAILIAVVIAAVVVMQVYMKRGISGRLKESSDKISGGEAFSASGTTTLQNSHMSANRVISEETGTDDKGAAADALTAVGTPVVADGSFKIQKLGDKAYSAGGSVGGDTSSNSVSRTLDASHESFKAGNVAQDGNATPMDDFAPVGQTTRPGETTN